MKLMESGKKQISNPIYLRHKLESCNCIGITDECESSAWIDHIANVIGANFMCQMTQNAEYRNARNQRCEGIQRCHNCRIPIHIVFEFIERRVHNQIAKAHGQREETLCNRCIPNLKWIFCQNSISTHRIRIE